VYVFSAERDNAIEVDVGEEGVRRGGREYAVGLKRIDYGAVEAKRQTIRTWIRC